MACLVHAGEAKASTPVYRETHTAIHHNWGYGGPIKSNTSHFTAYFNQTQNLQGDFFMQTMADTGIKVTVSGKTVINKWNRDRSTSSLANISRALLLNRRGKTSIYATYHKDGGKAGVYSDVVPLGQWLTYYYPTSSLTGSPSSAKVIKSSKLTDTTSNAARYVTAKRLAAGSYVIRGKADHDFDVLIDGVTTHFKKGNEQAFVVKITDRGGKTPSSEKNSHWIEVRAPKAVHNGHLTLTLDTYAHATSISASDGWLGEVFDNETFTGREVLLGGKGAIDRLTDLNSKTSNWGHGSPSPFIGSDTYSAVFSRVYSIKTAGYYQFSMKADDGAQVFVDGQSVPILDAWNYTPNEQHGGLYLTAGSHKIQIKFHEHIGASGLTFSLSQPTLVAKRPAIHDNWGSGGPKGPFTVVFDQSQLLNGNYFIQTVATTGLTMNVNGKPVIYKWGADTSTNWLANTSRAILMGQSGTPTIMTTYHNESGEAGIFSDVVPFGEWLRYDYPGSSLSGVPIAASTLASTDSPPALAAPALGLSSDSTHSTTGTESGTGVASPFNGTSSDLVSADNQLHLVNTTAKGVRYVTAKDLTAGKYLLTGTVDRDVTVYIDGTAYPLQKGQEQKIVLDLKDHSTGSFDQRQVHWIDVEAGPSTGTGSLDIQLQPYIPVKAQDPADGWVGTIFDNSDFTGKTAAFGGQASGTAVQDLTAQTSNWGTGSPSPEIGSDTYSALFSKLYTIDHDGYYALTLQAGTGAQVFIDEASSPVLDQWNDGSTIQHGFVYLTAGTHHVTVKYHHETGPAYITFAMTPAVTTYQAAEPSVHENWGAGSPDWQVAPDHFTATFDQSQNLYGDYFVQTMADEGIKMTVDGKALIDRWNLNTTPSSEQNIDRALLLNQSQGMHTIQTTYHEETGVAGLYSDVVPLGNWLSYTYSTDDGLGIPDAASVIPGTGSDHGLMTTNPKTSRYVTADHIPSGDYILRGKADRDLEIDVDGKAYTFPKGQEQAIQLTLQNTPENGDIHWLEVHAGKSTGAGLLSVSLQPVSEAAAITPADGWFGTIYSQPDFTGQVAYVGGHGAIDPIQALDATNGNWRNGSPSAFIDPSAFSARFRRIYTINQAGYYLLDLQSSTGARVYLDGATTPTIDGWTYEAGHRYARVYLTAGNHEVAIDYHKESGAGTASLFFDLSQPKGPVYLTTSYNVTFDQMLSMQMAIKDAPPVTDTYRYAYVASPFIDPTTSTVQLTNGALVEYDTPSTSSETIGTLVNGAKVTLLSQTTDKNWYKVQFNTPLWRPALSEDVAKALNPGTYAPGSKQYFEFLKLSEPAGLDANEVNDKILYDKGVLAGHAQDFIDAANLYHINEIYLISHALLESDKGRSDLATGADGLKYYNQPVYNFYGIHAYDSCPDQCGAQYAYQQQWFTVRAGIMGGAQFIAQGWISAGQDTLYKMRWNPGGAQALGYATHQYATDIGWATKQVTQMTSLYDMLGNYQLVFDVPQYNK